MLFLAVFCGFLAENKREHLVEKNRAKQFAISLLYDLKLDTATISNISDSREDKNKIISALMDELEKKTSEQNDSAIFLLTNFLLKRSYFTSNSGTYEQVKNSGSLRYFDKIIAATFVKYESYNVVLGKALDMEDKFMSENIIRLRNDICNPIDVRYQRENKPTTPSKHRVNKNPELQLELYKGLNYVYERNLIYSLNLSTAKELATDLVKKLEETYHIK